MVQSGFPFANLALISVCSRLTLVHFARVLDQSKLTEIMYVLEKPIYICHSKVAQHTP